MYFVFCELETETGRMLKQLTTEEKSEGPLEHALKVRNALAQSNYARFFKLYREAPNMGASLIDVFIDKIRLLALRNLAVGFVATGLDLAHITITLAFRNQEESEKFIRDLGCIITVTQDGQMKKMDCRSSIIPLRKAPLKVRRSVK